MWTSVLSADEMYVELYTDSNVSSLYYYRMKVRACNCQLHMKQNFNSLIDYVLFDMPFLGSHCYYDATDSS